MPAYKKCPRCQLNYILVTEDYCSICKDALRGIKVEDEEEDIYTKTCPRCGAPIPDDMDYCENCKQDLEDKIGTEEDENWDSEEDTEENESLNDGDDENMDAVEMADEEGFDDEEFGEEEEEEPEEEFEDEEEDFGFDNNVDDLDDYDEDEDEDDAE